MRDFYDLFRQKPSFLFMFTFHTSGYFGQDAGIMKLDAVSQVYAMINHN